ncbi:MAG: hypothetical protein FJ398_24760 [Verrucomicrobia bacterium]|nr:hypothetical protein [Verrucomicrobiota bacterium]
MTRWLKDDATLLPLETNKPPQETAEALACLANIPTDAANFRIQNQFTTLSSLRKPSSRTAWERRRAELLAQLREKVFRWFPTNSIPFETKILRGTGGWLTRYEYAGHKEVLFQAEDGARVRAQLFTPKGRPTGAPLLIYVKRPSDSIAFMDVDEWLPLLGRYAVLILNPRFTEQTMSAAEFTNIERTAVWMGRTIAAMRIWDVRRAVQWAVEEEKLAPASISLYGKDEMGAVALYAALFEERVTSKSS